MRTLPPAAAAQVDAVAALAHDVLGPDLVGVYLYGSATLGGLQPWSDVDLLVLSRRSLGTPDKRAMVDGVLALSIWPPPTVGPRAGQRPLELTVVAEAEVWPWRYPPRMELQFGEWLRAGLEGDPLSDGPLENPDLAVPLESVRRDGRAIAGPPPRAGLGPIPAGDLRASMVAGLDGLLAEVEPDTTNVLLTLVRIWFTIVTGEIAPKDLAAEWGIARLSGADRSILEKARAAYLGDESGDWDGLESRARALAEGLVGAIRAGEGRAP